MQLVKVGDELRGDGPFPKVDINDEHWVELFTEFMLKNKPCILNRSATKDWESRKRWVKRNICGTSAINLDYIMGTYGDMMVPIMDVTSSNYSSEKLQDYIRYVVKRDVSPGLKYIKDWHFQKESGTSYSTYGLPSFLRFDWINNEVWSNGCENPFGDYRFVYFGVKDTWTIFHSDVMSSYSWSANVCGRKLWYFVPPGKEEVFRKDRHGFLEDIRVAKEKWTEAEVVWFIQEPGEIVFVPSNWYHQVHNLEDAISINQNFINASNVDLMFRLVCKRLDDVRAEIADVANAFTKSEFEKQCQIILQADIRVNFGTLRRLLELVAADRYRFVDECWVCWKHLSLFECKNDSECLKAMVKRIVQLCTCKPDTSICFNCDRSMKMYELSCACECIEKIDIFEKENGIVE